MPIRNKQIICLCMFFIFSISANQSHHTPEQGGQRVAIETHTHIRETFIERIHTRQHSRPVTQQHSERNEQTVPRMALEDRPRMIRQPSYQSLWSQHVMDALTHSHAFAKLCALVETKNVGQIITQKPSEEHRTRRAHSMVAAEHLFNSPVPDHVVPDEPVDTSKTLIISRDFRLTTEASKALGNLVHCTPTLPEGLFTPNNPTDVEYGKKIFISALTTRTLFSPITLSQQPPRCYQLWDNAITTLLPQHPDMKALIALVKEQSIFIPQEQAVLSDKQRVFLLSDTGQLHLLVSALFGASNETFIAALSDRYKEHGTLLRNVALDAPSSDYYGHLASIKYDSNAWQSQVFDEKAHHPKVIQAAITKTLSTLAPLLHDDQRTGRR